MFTFSTSQADPSTSSASGDEVGPSPSRKRFYDFLLRSPHSESFLLVLTTLLVGIGTGGVSVVFRWMIDWVERISFTWIPEHVSWLGRGYLILVPAGGGLLVGPAHENVDLP